MNIGPHSIGEDYPPYIIAECCNNFAGDMSRARVMVDEAAAAGASACKFQMREGEGRISRECHQELQDACRLAGIEYLCTPFSLSALDFLVEVMEVPALKLGAAQVCDEQFLHAARDSGVPVLWSTGGLDRDGMAKVYGALSNARVPHCPMFSVTQYPTPYNRVPLAEIDLARNGAFIDPVGWSDHSIGPWCALGAVALGACVVEKHFTLDRSLPGPDQVCSLEPQELRGLVTGCRAIWEARDVEKSVYPEELKKIAAVRAALNA